MRRRWTDSEPCVNSEGLKLSLHKITKKALEI